MPDQASDTSSEDLARALAGRRVLVTGASGFIGSHVTRRLLGLNATVVALTSRPNGVAAADESAGRLEVVVGDLRDADSMQRVVANSRPDMAIHMAALTHVGRSFEHVTETIQTNVNGTVNLLTALDGSFERCVYVGTSDVYGDGEVPFREADPVRPLSPYAVSKYAAERFCRMYHQAHGWPIVCVRPFNTYGPGQSVDRVIPEIIAAGLRRQPLRMTGGTQTREFTFVDDMVDGIVRALATPGVDGEVFNLGRGEEVSMRTLATTVLALLDNPVEPEFGALAYRPTEIWRMFGDSSRARELLGWAPRVSLVDGLAQTVDWYRRQLVDQT